MLDKLKNATKKYVRNLKYKKRNIYISENTEIDNTYFGDDVFVAHHAQISNSTVGNMTSIGRYSKIQYADIGKYCSISWDVTIGALDHYLNRLSTHAFTYRKRFGVVDKDTYIKHKRVHIENDVWIGCNAIIMPGIHIANGAVIGAGAIVTHDVAPYEIVAGIPAKHIGDRFDKNIAETINKSKWWNINKETLRKNINIFETEINEENWEKIASLLNKLDN